MDLSPEVIKLAQLLTGLMAAPKPDLILDLDGLCVTIKRAAELTGYTQKAIRRKIEDGVWVVGKEWKHAPDGRVLIIMDGYKKWQLKGQASKRGRTASASTSSMKVSGSALLSR